MAAEPLTALLSRALAESYALMLKSHNYHWNVTGPYFKELHDLFQLQYEELFLAVDEIAEHIRTCGALAPGSLREFAALSQLSEPNATNSDMEMLEDLARSNDTVAATFRAVLRAAEKVGDDGSVDLAVQRVRAHGKAAWMLRASMSRGAAKAEARSAPVTRAPRPARLAKTKAKPKPKPPTSPLPKQEAAAATVVQPRSARPGGRPRSGAKASG